MACIVAGKSPSAFGSYNSPSIHDSDIEIWTTSPWNHGFQTPRTCDIQATFVESRMTPVLTIRDENLLRNERGKRVVSPCLNIPEENRLIALKRPSSPLKRKRPQRLNIPFQLPGLNALCTSVDQPTEVNVEGFHYAVSCKRGRREIMEDTHKANVNLLGHSKQAFFGVFDGHSGRKAAAFAVENIGQNIVDAMILGMEVETENNLEQAVKAGYLKTDAEFLKQEVGSGTACVTALIINGNLVVSNAGDCRAVISRYGSSEALTCDHRAARKDEQQRIENLGGIVDIRHGVWRVQGSLAVSRAVGDSHMKEWITAEPDTRRIEITSDCEFLILASDGLWDKVSNQEAVDIARPFCLPNQPNLTPLGGGPIAACKKVVELAVTRKSQDDVSVMIVQLQHYCMKEN